MGIIRIIVHDMDKPLAAANTPAGQHRTASQPDTPRRLSADDLLAGQRRVLIEHRGQAYTLSRTRQDKLILTK